MKHLLFLYLLFSGSLIYAKNSKECINFAQAKAYIDLKKECPSTLKPSCKVVKKAGGIPVKCSLGIGEKADLDKLELRNIYKKTIQNIRLKKPHF